MGFPTMWEVKRQEEKLRRELGVLLDYVMSINGTRVKGYLTTAEVVGLLGVSRQYLHKVGRHQGRHLVYMVPGIGRRWGWSLAWVEEEMAKRGKSLPSDLVKAWKM